MTKANLLILRNTAFLDADVKSKINYFKYDRTFWKKYIQYLEENNIQTIKTERINIERRKKERRIKERRKKERNTETIKTERINTERKQIMNGNMLYTLIVINLTIYFLLLIMKAFEFLPA